MEKNEGGGGRERARGGEEGEGGFLFNPESEVFARN